MTAQFTTYRLLDSKVEPYDSNYPRVFQTVKELITQVISEVVIEHIGSTAIPGMYAKRIIDILMSYPREGWEDLLGKLDLIGFQETPFNNIPEDRPMKVAGVVFSNQFYNIHVHLTSPQSDVHLDNIYFCKQLRQNPQLAKEYEQIKQQAVRDGKVAATEYNLVKSPFIQRVLQGRRN